MATFDRMIIDDRDLANRYFGDNNFDDLNDDDQYLFSKPTITTNNRQQFSSNPLTTHDTTIKTDDDNMGLFGRRVYLESPSLGNKEDEELYRYVPSRLSDHQSGVMPKSIPAPTGETLLDSLDFELDLLGAANRHHAIPYRTNTHLLQETKPPAPLTQLTNPLTPMTNMRRADPRQDPLLGPLLAELDAMSTQQQRLTQPPPPPPPPPLVPIYRRNSVPYEPTLSRPTGLSHTNYALTTTANRTVNDALLEAALYDSLDTRDQQNPPTQQRQSVSLSAPNINSLNQSQQQQQQQYQQQQQQQYHQQPSQHQQSIHRRSNMNTTDIFMPSSYDHNPASFLNNFRPEDQLFQQPVLNNIGQNYVPNPRQQPPPPPSQQQQQKQQQHHHQQQQHHEQHDTTFDNSYTQMSPPYRGAYAPPRHPPNNDNQQQQQPPSNRQIPDDDNNDPFNEYNDMYPPSQYQRPPQPPSQQRPPPPQQQRPMPPPSQQKYDRFPPPPPQQQQQQQQQQQYYDEQIPHPSHRSNNQEMFFTDHNDDQLEQFSYQHQQQQPPSTNNQHNIDQQNDQDSRRQAIWNELQRTNAKVQEKNAKKRESANRREQLLKGTSGANNNAWSGSQQSSAQSKVSRTSPPQRRPPPIPVPKTNYIDENIDMIRNKENFYHRYPAKKYENLYTKRKDLGGNPNEKKTNQNQDNSNMDYDQTQTSSLINNTVVTYPDNQHRASLPITINLNPDNNTGNGTLHGSKTIPLDSQVTRVGDKISVNIDLRLTDLQHLKHQQQNERPDWSGLDPLDRHIRKLERSIDQSLPPTHSPRDRSPTFSNQTVNPSMGRYGKTTMGAGRSGYSPPSYSGGGGGGTGGYSGDHYGYSGKGQKEDSYLAKMNHTRKGPHFKPYTGRDYEEFKKNYAFGTGTLGFDFENPNYKEKNDKLIKTKEYAQQIETRNKKILAEAPRRTLSDTRVPTEPSKNQRAVDYARTATRHKPPSGTSMHSTPPQMNGSAPPAPPGRRPTDVAQRPSPVRKQATKFPQNDDNELVERLAQRHEREKAQVQGILNPSQKRREQLFDDDDRRVTDIERLAQDRANQRRLSPPRQSPPRQSPPRQVPPSGSTNTGNGRRPLRFDKPLIPDESAYPPQPQYRPIVQQSPPPPPVPAPSSSQRPISNQHQEHEQRYEQQYEQQQPQQRHEHHETHVTELTNRHNDEKMLMEAIRQELSERPLADDEELIVVEQ